jgi:DNA-3-methyladenine glycosylase
MKPAPPVTQTVRDVMQAPLSPSSLAGLSPLGRGFYQPDTRLVAREMLGKILVREHGDGLAIVRITETEAYLGAGDPACHTFGARRTPRNEVMWGEAGRLYVYFTYGMHFCANVVTRGPGEPEAVLLRGAVPVGGEELMSRRRRGIAGARLVDGPAKLCQALALDRGVNGLDLTERGGLWLADDALSCRDGWVAVLPRVGVAYAGEAAQWPLRFLVRLEQPALGEASGGATAAMADAGVG